ncbi:hypothetical protein HKX48_004838 [Thoreauomyces humboldtii]|nr:hypothetical protein HKX48_004838 [Thoreauomyces humboldtii]
MDLDAGGSFLDQLQNQLHPDTTPEGSSHNLNAYHEPEVVAPVAATPEPSSYTPEPSSLDIGNEELFPALPVAAPGKRVTSGWARPASKPSANGSRTVPQASPGGISRPKKATERFEIPAQLQAGLQNEKGKPITGAYVCRQIMTRLGTSVELSTNGRTGSLTVIVTGKSEAVKQTKREIISALTLQVSETITIPQSVRPHLVGKAGANIKALMARTLTKIDMPRQTEEEQQQSSVPEDLLEDEPQQDVVIIGDYEGVAEAKAAIEEIVAQRTSKRTLKISIERSYFPFISGPNGSQVKLLELETETRIHVPPVLASAEGASGDILIVGERSAVLVAEERLKEIYEEIKRTTKTLQIPVNKRQHRFIIGPKGATLLSILEQTGCHVELPPTADPSDLIVIRGPDNMLSAALQLVIEKSNSVVISEVDIVETIAATTSSDLFMRYVYTKERAQLKSIETTHNATIMQQKGPNGPILEIQAKTKADADSARTALHSAIKEWGNTLCFGIVEIPSGLHKFVIGKGGQNITKVKAQPGWNGRLVDVVVSYEADQSDEVIIVVKRTPVGKGGLAANDEEALSLIEKVKKELESQATVLADLVTLTANVDVKYHGRLIGSGGAALKEFLEPYDNAVSVRFPKTTDTSAADKKAGGKEADSTAIVVRGPKKDATEVVDKLVKQAAEWRHVELMSNFSEVINVPKGVGKRLIGSGKEIKWIATGVREKIASGEVHKSKVPEKDLAPPNLNLRAELDSGATEDVVTLYGPKIIVELARAVVEERAKKLADTITEDVDLFATVSKDARKQLEDAGGDIKKRILRRIIGKEGRGVKKLSEKHSVTIRFADRQRKHARNDDEEDEDNDVPSESTNEAAAGKVAIKGSKGDVAAASKELVQLVQHEIFHSSVSSFRLPKSCLPQVVGRAGSKVQRLKEQHKVRIDFNDLEDDDEQVECVIEGSQEGCEEVEKKIHDLIDDLTNTESADILIPSYLHKYLIGPGGSRIRSVVDRLGGQDKVKIQFPRAQSDAVVASDAITVKGNTKLIPTVREELHKLLNEALVAEKGEGAEVEVLHKSASGVISETISIPKSDVARVAGRGGDALSDLTRKHGVTIWCREKEKESEDATYTLVAREGNEAALKAVKDELASKVRVSQTVALPAKVLEGLQSTNGSEHHMHLEALHDLVKRVRQDCGIQPEVDASGYKDVSEGYLTVRGDAGTVKKALKLTEKALEDLTRYSHTDRFQVGQEFRPHLIGRQGLTIARIRTESGAEVDILRSKSKGGKDTVSIRAMVEENLHRAREMIDNIVRDQTERLARDQERDAAHHQHQQEASHHQQPNGKHSADARIDDDPSSEPASASASDAGGYRSAVPGYSGRANVTGSKNRKLALEPKTPATPPEARNAVTGNYWQYVGENGAGAAKSSTEWSQVPSKKSAKTKEGDAAKAPVPGSEAATEPGAPGTGKNKKKKKKSAAATAATAPSDAFPAETPSAEVEESNEPPALETVDTPAPKDPKAKPAPAAKSAPTPTPAAAKIERAPSPAPAPAKAAAPAPATKPEVSPTPLSPKKQAAPAPPVVAASSSPASAAPAKKDTPSKPVVPKPDEFESLPPQEDEWQTVNTVKKYKQAKLASDGSAPHPVNGGGSVVPASAAARNETISFGAVPANLLQEDGEGPKKKKNKPKKKKKSGNGASDAVVMPGDEE